MWLDDKEWQVNPAPPAGQLRAFHLQDGDLREVFLFKVGVRDELQLGLKEAVEGLQGEGHALNSKGGS